MKSKSWTQRELAEKTGMMQPRISAMLKPGGVKFTLETLSRLASALDVGLMVKFVPFSELARWSEQFDPESFHVPSFDEETGRVRDPRSNKSETVPQVSVAATAGTNDETWTISTL